MVACGLFLLAAAVLACGIYVLGWKMNKAQYYRMMWWLPVFISFCVGMGYLFLSRGGMFSLRVENLGQPDSKTQVIMTPLFAINALLRVVTAGVGCLMAKLHLHRTVGIFTGAVICSVFAYWSTLVPGPSHYAIYSLAVFPLSFALFNWLFFHDRPWGGHAATTQSRHRSVFRSRVPCLVVIIYTLAALVIWCTTSALELAGHAFADSLSPSDEVAAFIIIHCANLLLFIVAAIFADAPGRAPQTVLGGASERRMEEADLRADE